MSIRFYSRCAFFALHEELSGISNAVGRLILYPFFIWLLATMWKKFAHGSTIFTPGEMFLYVGITEVIQMNTLRYDAFTRASSDFSLSLARPRSWLLMQGCGLFGRTLGKMIVQSIFFVVVVSLMTGNPMATLLTALRYFTLAPIIALMDAGLCLVFANGKVVWDNVGYFRLPFSKFFLVFGGVLAPVADFAEPWRHWLLRLPFSDLIFQPAHFAVKGHFYDLTSARWIMHMALLLVFFVLINMVGFVLAKNRHNSYGG